MKLCYDKTTMKYDNSKCSKNEECAFWNVASVGKSRNGCILKKYCWADGSYLDAEAKDGKVDKVKYTCPNT